MIVVYEKKTNKFVGMAPQIFDNGEMRDFTLEELYPDLDAKKHGSFTIDDSPKYVQQPDHWQFKLDKKGVPIGIEHKPTLSLKITTDLEDTDGDGMPELKADGVSKAKLKVQVYDGLKLKKTNAKIKLSTTGGRLDARIFDLKNQNQFTASLQSTTETITITVTASAEGMHADSLTFELMP
ncbi:MAG TPA: hypothetical protein ENJ82_13550 [Bacteroidetes bacterium]|nr:hypothetical protein [Bacteroidota bacterium]